MFTIEADCRDTAAILRALLACHPKGPEYPIFLKGSTKMTDKARERKRKAIRDRTYRLSACPYRLYMYTGRGLVFYWRFMYPKDATEREKQMLDTKKHIFDRNIQRGIYPKLMRTRYGNDEPEPSHLGDEYDLG